MLENNYNFKKKWQLQFQKVMAIGKCREGVSGKERKGGMLEMLCFFFTHSLTNFVIFPKKEKKTKLLLFMCKVNLYFIFYAKFYI
jgi:hypothetical protein